MECFYEVRPYIEAKLRCWQQLRIAEFDGGLNAHIETKPELLFIPELLGFTPKRVILSVMPERTEPYCTMIDGVDASREWHSDISAVLAAIAKLI